MALSEQDAVALKRTQASGQAVATPAVASTVKVWRTTTVANALAAAAFLNEPPPQGANEAFVADNPDGSLTVFYFL